MQRALTVRASSKTMQVARTMGALSVFTTPSRSYMAGPFMNPVRRPQLTEEERSKVVVNQNEWPEEFKDYDPENPYKGTPDWHENISVWSVFLLGIEVGFIVTFLDVVFPQAYKIN
eukprot:PhF_6_TR24310/c0_g1_i1/m.33744